MRRTLIILLLTTTWSSKALADQLDGQWCNAQGQRLAINGPNIEIPSGRKIRGHYARHVFTYTGPDGDPEAGQKIRIVQRSDEHMKLYRSTAPGKAEDWHRCNFTS